MGLATPALQKTANRWVPPSQSDKNVNDDEVVFRRMRGLLNKLTVENCDKIVKQLLQMDLQNPVIMQGLVILIFDKAVDEPHFSSLYADVCLKLKKSAPNLDDPGSKAGPTFKRLLVKRCRDEFNNRARVFDEFDEKAANGPLSPEDVERRLITKAKMLGNIKFIGEIGKLGLISERILHECIQELLKKVKVQNADVDDVECLCKLLQTVGKQLDHPKAANIMNRYFERIEELANAMEMPARIRFMLQDIIELRKNQWVPRREISEPKALKEIRQEFAMDNHGPNLNNRRGNYGGGVGPQRMGYGVGGHPRPQHDMMYGGNHPQFMPGPYPGQASRFNPPLMGHGNPLVSGQFMGGQSFGRSMSGSSGGAPHRDNMGRNMIRPTQRLSYDAELSRQAAMQGKQPDELEQLRLRQQERKTGARNDAGHSLRPQNTMIPLGALPPSAISNTPPASQMPVLADPGVTTKFTALTKPKGTRKFKNKKDYEAAVTRLLQDYTGAKEKDRDEIVRTITTWNAPAFNESLVAVVFKNSLESKENSTTVALARLLVELWKKEVIKQDTAISGVSSVLRGINDLMLDVPMSGQRAGMFLAQANECELLSLKDIFSVCAAHNLAEVYLDTLVAIRDKPSDIAQPEALQSLAKDLSNLKLDLCNLLPQNERNGPKLYSSLKDRGLEPLKPLLQLAEQLGSMLKTNPSAQSVLEWLLAHPATDQSDPEFMAVVASNIIAHCVSLSTFREDLNEKEKTNAELAQFKEFSPTLAYFTKDRPGMQLATLYALQVFCYDNDFPKGLMTRGFMIFYKFEVCESEAFFAWKEDVNDKYPGKGQALFQVNQWLNWLEDYERDSGDEE